MKLSINWLKDYVDPKLTTDELVHRLTMAGLEVEEVHVQAGDTVLELEITPNRPDCLNMIGLAREISAITAKNLKLPRIKNHRAGAASKTAPISVAIEQKKDCGRYIATLVRDAHISTAPDWMQQRIASAGIRPINNAVDITNFVLMETGQPLHAFDYDKLIGGKIVVRRARAGEVIVTLDGVERKLDPSILVIADAQKPVAIAGIMGGLGTQITPATKNILLESAHFDMGLVRRACRTLGLKSDSSYRFERGIDFEGVLTGANRATDLLIELTKGKLAGRVQAGQSRSIQARSIELSLSDIEDLLGTRVSKPKVTNALRRLGLRLAAGKGQQLKITPPGFRTDLKQPVDIIEEVARTIGYDRLDVSFPEIKVNNIAVDDRPRQVRRRAAEVLLAQGYSEVITYSLISQKDLDRTGLKLPAVALQNSLSQEHNLLRPSLLPSLLSVALTNANRGQKDLRLFEIGKCYFASAEQPVLGILATGRRAYDWRRNAREQVDFYDLKGVLGQMFKALGAQADFEPACEPGFDATACAAIKISGHPVGVIGRIDKKVLIQWGIKSNDMFASQVQLRPLFALEQAQRKYQPIAEFPSIQRDISIAVGKDVAYAKIVATCRHLGAGILQNIHLIEEYTGDKIQSGLRGLVFALTYQSPQRTLREEEVNTVHSKILEALVKECGATQR